MGQYGSDGWWQPDDDMDFPPGGMWKRELSAMGREELSRLVTRVSRQGEESRVEDDPVRTSAENVPASSQDNSAGNPTSMGGMAGQPWGSIPSDNPVSYEQLPVVSGPEQRWNGLNREQVRELLLGTDIQLPSLDPDENIDSQIPLAYELNTWGLYPSDNPSPPSQYISRISNADTAGIPDGYPAGNQPTPRHSPGGNIEPLWMREQVDQARIANEQAKWDAGRRPTATPPTGWTPGDTQTPAKDDPVSPADRLIRVATGLVNAVTSPVTGTSARATSTGSSGVSGGTGLASGVDPMWYMAFVKEHGMTPEQYYKTNDLTRALEEKQASEIWAAKHGNNPMSWGNSYGDNRVPREIFERIASARRSPDVGPKGAEAWGDYADKMGGALMAMRGQRYHPVEATGEGTATGTKNTLLQAIIGALRK